MSKHVPLDETAVSEISRLVVAEVFQRAIKGELRVPITATVCAVDVVLLNLIFPGLDGRVEIGPLQPILPIEAPVCYPLSVNLEDGEHVISYSLDAPPPAIN